MQTHEIRNRFLSHFERNGPHQGAQRLADGGRPEPAVRQRRHGASSSRTSSARRRRRTRARPACRSACARRDIDEVGKTTRHNTFFQMAGNFSFGDYFKEGAIELAWQLITGSQDEGGYGFDPDRIWATVYDDDDEALELWRKIAGLPDGAHPAPRRQGQLLGHGRARSRRPVLGDLLRPRPRARPRGRPGRRRGPLPGDLEPGLHAGRPRRAEPEEGAQADRRRCRRRTSTPAWASSASPRCCRASRTSTRPTWSAR